MSAPSPTAVRIGSTGTVVASTAPGAKGMQVPAGTYWHADTITEVIEHFRRTSHADHIARDILEYFQARPL